MESRVLDGCSQPELAAGYSPLTGTAPTCAVVQFVRRAARDGRNLGVAQHPGKLVNRNTPTAAGAVAVVGCS